MTDEADLQAAIAANPADDSPRLIYADWLDDRGEHRLAAFIRHQVALAKLVIIEDYDSDEYAEAMKFFAAFGVEDVAVIFSRFHQIVIDPAELTISFEKLTLRVVHRQPDGLGTVWFVERGLIHKTVDSATVRSEGWIMSSNHSRE
jgi:uncharacterized protein (TIGR02996 family)